MPRSSPYTIKLSCAEEAELHRRASKYTLPYFQVQRAKMILYAAQGMSNDEIADCLDTRREVVSLWRKRFFTDRLAGLEERDRPGRPRTFPQNSWYKLRPLPASCRRSTTCLYRVGALRIWFSKSNRAAWWLPSAALRCGAGCRKTPSGPGITVVGSSPAIPSSLPRRAECSICTLASGKARP